MASAVETTPPSQVARWEPPVLRGGRAKSTKTHPFPQRFLAKRVQHPTTANPQGKSSRVARNVSMFVSLAVPGHCGGVRRSRHKLQKPLPVRGLGGDAGAGGVGVRVEGAGAGLAAEGDVHLARARALRTSPPQAPSARAAKQTPPTISAAHLALRDTSHSSELNIGRVHCQQSRQECPQPEVRVPSLGCASAAGGSGQGGGRRWRNQVLSFALIMKCRPQCVWMPYMSAQIHIQSVPTCSGRCPACICI